MMRTFKVPAFASLFALSAVVLFGCPIYSSGQDNVICNSEGLCCDPTESNCTCYTSLDCPSDEYCSLEGVCTPANSFDGGGFGDGGVSDGGDCSTLRCPDGLTCVVAGGSATCVSTDGGFSEAGVGDASFDVTVIDTGTGDTGVDSGIDSPVLPPFTGCTSDNACTADSGVGARCLDGKCVAAADQCSDSTQCASIGTASEACVQGVCTATCAGSTICPSGYSCSADGTAVCTGNPTPCGAADGGEKCGSGTTCVDQHCVPQCNADAGPDAAGSCGVGLVCVDNGCIPDQAPKLLCQTDGLQGTCAVGSICLHHNCYIACTLSDAAATDGGGTCQHADAFNVCKAVQTSNGTYDVCGSNSNLGNQCDPTQGKNCLTPAICIDGFCR